MIQFRHSVLPLFAVRSSAAMPSNARDIRYAGVSYHFNDQGDIATCAHIVNGLAEGERLVAIEMHGSCLMFPVDDLRCHPKHDFAVGRVRRQNYKSVALSDQPEVFIGTDVMAFGFTTAGLVDEKLITMPRLFKGHVVRTHAQPSMSQARSTCELSFPSHNGFSGTPVWLDAPKTCAVGMLYGNYESTITLHKCTEVNEVGDSYSEEIHRVVELGAAHTAPDIRSFLDDLGITRIALATPARAHTQL
jgi:hypothetical protein